MEAGIEYLLSCAEMMIYFLWGEALILTQIGDTES